MALLWNSETLSEYDQLRTERAESYAHGDFSGAAQLALTASTLAIDSEDPIRAAINLRDVSFALLHDLTPEKAALAWKGASHAIKLTEPFEEQEMYGQESRVAPILDPRREQAANYLCRLRVALHALRKDVPVNETFDDEKLLHRAILDYGHFAQLLVPSEGGDARPDQYWVNAQQDFMLLESMRGHARPSTYLRCLGTVAITESTRVAHSNNLGLLSPKRLKIAARQAAKVTLNLFAHK